MAPEAENWRVQLQPRGGGRQNFSDTKKKKKRSQMGASLRAQASRLDTSTRMWPRSCRPSHWCLFLCFQLLFPILGSSMKFTHTRARARAHTHTRCNRSVHGHFQVLLTISLPYQGAGKGCRGACVLPTAGEPPAGPDFGSFRALPSPPLQHGAARLASAPSRGDLLAGRAESQEFGDLWPRPTVALSPAHGSGWGEAVSSLSGLRVPDWKTNGLDAMGCGFPHRRAPRGPGTGCSRGEELLGRASPHRSASHRLRLTRTASGGDWGPQFSHEQTEAQRGAVTCARPALEPMQRLAPPRSWEGAAAKTQRTEDAGLRLQRDSVRRRPVRAAPEKPGETAGKIRGSRRTSLKGARAWGER